MLFKPTLLIAAVAIPAQSLAISSSGVNGQCIQNKKAEVEPSVGKYNENGKRLKYNATIMVNTNVIFKPGEGRWNTTNVTEMDKSVSQKFIAYSDTPDFEHTFSLDLNNGKQTTENPKGDSYRGIVSQPNRPGGLNKMVEGLTREQCHFGNKLEGAGEEWEWQNV